MYYQFMYLLFCLRKWDTCISLGAWPLHMLIFIPCNFRPWAKPTCLQLIPLNSGLLKLVSQSRICCFKEKATLWRTLSIQKYNLVQWIIPTTAIIGKFCIRYSSSPMLYQNLASSERQRRKHSKTLVNYIVWKVCHLYKIWINNNSWKNNLFGWETIGEMFSYRTKLQKMRKINLYGDIFTKS